MKKMICWLLLLALLGTMLVAPVYAQEASLCPCGCGQTLENVQWKPWNGNGDASVASGHYYLESNYTQKAQIVINSGIRVVIDLRGYKLTAVQDTRLMLCYGYCAVVDSVGGGRMCGNTTGSGYGGVLLVSTYETMGSAFELYGGTITLDENHKGSRRGGLISVGDTCTFRMYGGTIQGGTTYSKLADYAETKDDGGGIYASSKATVEILGGKIIGCKADRYGGAIYSLGTTVIKNCTITGGEAEGGGGNICQNGGSLTIENATISNGVCSASTNGGGNINVMSGATISVKNSTIRNGYSNYNGGNLYIGSCAVTLDNAKLEAGVAGKRGNNLYGSTAATGLTIRDCQLPGDIAYAGADLKLEGLVKIGLLNYGLRLRFGEDQAKPLDATGLDSGSEIFVNAKDTFTTAGADPDHFKGTNRVVVSEGADGLVATIAASGEMGGYCPHCGQRVAWKAFNKTTCVRTECFGDVEGDEDPTCTKGHIATGHYYLTASDSSFTQRYVGAVVSEDPDGDGTKTNITKSSDDVVLDLAGYTLTSSGRAFYVREGGEGFDPSSLTLLDSYGGGTIKGKGTKDQGGGVFYGETAVDLTFYGGNYQYVTEKVVRNGGVVYSGGYLTIHGGTFNGGAYENTSYSGGAIYETSGRALTITAGRFVGGIAKEGGTVYCAHNTVIAVTGGQFTGGTAATGGNIRVVGTSENKTGTLNMSGCSITGGHGTTSAGNFSATYYSQLNLSDSYLAEGSTDDYGGNISVGTNSTFANFTDLIVYKGTATRGANIYSAGTGARANLIRCYVTDGVASGYGANFYAGNGYLVIKGGYYGYGIAKTYAGNIYAGPGKSLAANYLKIQADEKGNVPMIVGGKAGTYGGNLYINSVLELTDAIVHNGTAQANRGQDIWYAATSSDHKAHKLTIGAGVKGEISFAANNANYTDPIFGMPLADTECAALNAKITVETLDIRPQLVAKDGALYVASVAVVDESGADRWYAANADAVEACQTDEYVKLYTTDPVVLTKNCAVDLNGKTVSVSGKYTLYGMDSTGGGVATLAAETQYLQNYAAPDGVRYLAIADGTKVSWHALDMYISAVSLRPGASGIYYNAVWNVDDVLAGKIKEFGVALSLSGMPTADFVKEGTSLYTKMQDTELVSGKEMTSCIISNILKTDATYVQDTTTYTGAEANDLRGQLKIYATPYVLLDDGSYLVADDATDKEDDVAWSMKDVLNRLGTLVVENPEQYRRHTPALRDFYGKWKDNGMANWGLSGNYAFEAEPEDDVLDILMIGNSYNYYYVEEMHEMAKAAGVKLRVCNLYYSGCDMIQHYPWWLAGAKKYQYFEAVDGGKVKTDGVSMEWALMQRQWDVLSFQLSSSEMRKYTVEESLALHREARDVLYGYLREQFPQAQLYFHQNWSYEIGHTRDDGYVMENLEQQIAYTEHIRQIATGICAENGVGRINTGDAWEIYRAACDEAGIAHNLTARLGKDTLTGEAHSGDGTHDGDIGGGQYLNACVWFEILTGRDCRENTYVPTYTYDGTTYTMDETMRSMLQDAAHKAVTEVLPTYPEFTK